MSRRKTYLVLEIEIDEDKPDATPLYPHFAGIRILEQIKFDSQESGGLLARWHIKCLCSMSNAFGLFFYNDDRSVIEPILDRLNKTEI